MSDIRYQFVASGQDSVVRAFDGIEAAAKRNAKAVEGSYTAQGAAARRNASVQEREARRPADRLSQLAKQVERDQVRAAQREATERARALQYVARIRDKHFTDEQRSGQRAAVLKSRMEQQSIRDRQRSLDFVSRIRERHMAGEARKEQAHQNRVLQIFEQSQKQKITTAEQAGRRQAQTEIQFRERVKREREQSLGRVGGELKGLALGGAVAAGALGLGIGGAAIKDGLDLQKLANRISINARKNGQDFIDPSTLRREFEATSVATNGVVGAADVGAGMQRYIQKTGNIQQAREFSSTFAKTASATDTSFEFVASAGAELAQKFKIETAKEMQDALAAITFGGKEGAFELSDAASKYAKLASAGSRFGLNKGVGGVRTLQGLSQLAMAETGDRDTATTAVEAMFRQMVTESGNIKKKLGVDVFTDKTHTKTNSIEKLLPEVIAKAGGDMTKLQDIFKDEGIRGVSGLITTFNRTYQETKGDKKAKTAAGKAAVNAQLQSAINAPGTFADIEKDAARASQSPGAKLEATWARLTATMADKALPIIDRMADRFEVSGGAIDAFVGTLEVLLQIIEGFALTFGIIKANDPEQRRQKDKVKAKEIDKELAELPTLEKVAALGAQGKTKEAQEMLAKYQAPGMAEHITQLMAQRNVAQKGVDEGKALEERDRQIQRGMNKDQFAAMYDSLGGGASTEDSRRRAQIVAQTISQMPSGTVYSGEDALTGETEAQKRARISFAQSTSEERVRMGGKADEAGSDLAGKGLAAMFDRIKKSADGAATSLAKLDVITQPSIVRN